MLSGGRAGTLRDLSGCHRLSGWLESLIPGYRGQGSGHIRVVLRGPLGPKGGNGPDTPSRPDLIQTPPQSGLNENSNLSLCLKHPPTPSSAVSQSLPTRRAAQRGWSVSPPAPPRPAPPPELSTPGSPWQRVTGTVETCPGTSL